MVLFGATPPLLDSIFDPVDARLLQLLSSSRSGSSLIGADWSLAEWQEVLHQATRLTVSPLLCEALRQGALAAPAVVAQNLRSQYAESALRNLAIYHRLHIILEMLRRQAIEVIVFKGAYLAQSVYGDVALRPMSDVDVMVRGEDLARVRASLIEQGFVCDDTNGAMTEQLHHNRFLHPSAIPPVEVHWAPLKPGHFHIDLDGLWERTCEATVAGVPVRVLSPVDTLLHLCIHTSYQHIFHHFSLRCLCDIQHTVCHYGERLEWSQFCSRSEAWRANRSVYLALRLANELLNVAVPPFVLEQLRPDDFDHRLLEWAAQRVMGRVNDERGPWSTNLALWHLKTGPTERAALAKRICFPPRRLLAQEYGAPADAGYVPLLYPLRWATLALGAFRHLFEQHKRRREAKATVAWTEREIGRTALVRWLHGEGEAGQQFAGER